MTSNETAQLLAQVVDYHPGLALTAQSDTRKVGVLGVYDLERYLTNLGFNVQTRHEPHEPQPRQQHPAVIASAPPDVMFSTWPESMLLVLEWAGNHAAEGVASVACAEIAKGWLAKRRGRQQSRTTTRNRAVVIARWRLWLEFDAELADLAPVEEAQLDGGAWQVKFRVDGYELAAIVPVDVDDLAQPDAVRLSRRRVPEPSSDRG